MPRSRRVSCNSNLSLPAAVSPLRQVTRGFVRACRESGRNAYVASLAAETYRRVSHARAAGARRFVSVQVPGFEPARP